MVVSLNPGMDKRWIVNGLILAYLCFFLFKQKISEKSVGFSRIKTPIVRVESEHTDH